MPLYLYTCKEGHTNTIVHGMNEIVKPFCSVCGGSMWKKPQALNIKRSCFIEPSPAVRKHLETANQQRDQYREKRDGS